MYCINAKLFFMEPVSRVGGTAVPSFVCITGPTWGISVTVSHTLFLYYTPYSGLRTKVCNASYMGYYVDYYATTDSSSSDYTLSKVSNHDYFISKWAFSDIWSDKAPDDDPGQPVGTHRKTSLEIIMAAY
jgi:hypothetical protein